jgi:flagella basal body P-ring formation protein FlgA
LRTFLIITASILSLIFASLTLEAKEIQSNQIEPLIKKEIISHYKNLYDGEINVSCGRMPGIPFDVPEGKLEIKVKTSLRDDFVQRTIARISIYVDGKFQRALGVPVTLALYEDVWIASQPISRDDALSNINIEKARRDISRLAGTAARVNNDLVNTRVKKTFRTGDILDHRFIEKDPVVVRNSLVEIIFQSNSVAISIPGEAMENGQMGDIIRVKSNEFDKEYMGKIIDRGTILVNI